MKKTFARLLTFMILVGILFPGSGYGPRARAADVSPQGGVGTFSLVSSLPSKICLGDSHPLLISVQGNPTTDSQFVILTDNSVTQSRWNITAGAQIGPPKYTGFTATKLGGGFINFGFVDGPSGQTLSFEVVECDYLINIKASSTTKAEKITFRTTVSGDGKFSSSDGGGNGTYVLTFSPDLEENPDDPCVLTGNTSGNSNFSVEGGNNNGTLSLTINFADVVTSSSPQYICHDENDNHGIVAMFEGATVNPNTALHLTGVTFARGQTQRSFPFGTNGKCTITVTKREKK